MDYILSRKYINRSYLVQVKYHRFDLNSGSSLAYACHETRFCSKNDPLPKMKIA